MIQGRTSPKSFIEPNTYNGTCALQYRKKEEYNHFITWIMTCSIYNKRLQTSLFSKTNVYCRLANQHACLVAFVGINWMKILLINDNSRNVSQLISSMSLAPLCKERTMQNIQNLKRWWQLLIRQENNSWTKLYLQLFKKYKSARNHSQRWRRHCAFLTTINLQFL